MAEAVLNRDAGDQQGQSGASPEAPTGSLQDVVRPQVLAAFEGENVSMLPRPELALRIGQVVTQHLENTGATLNLLERRKLVSDLIDWLVRCQSDNASDGRDLTKTEEDVDDLLKKSQQDGSGSPTSLAPNMLAAKKKITLGDGPTGHLGSLAAAEGGTAAPGQ